MQGRSSFDFGPLVGLGILIYLDLRMWSMLVKYLHLPVALAGALALVVTALLGYGLRLALRAAAAEDRLRDAAPPTPAGRPKGTLPPMSISRSAHSKPIKRDTTE